MPTTEWLNKYESIKDKLACKTDLDAHFTEKVIGNREVDVLDIGTVNFLTGTIFACDPMVELEDTPPFIQTITAGTYPVKICVVPSEKYGDCYASHCCGRIAQRALLFFARRTRRIIVIVLFIAFV